jgi:hypothetical protein
LKFAHYSTEELQQYLKRCSSALKHESDMETRNALTTSRLIEEELERRKPRGELMPFGNRGHGSRNRGPKQWKRTG